MFLYLLVLYPTLYFWEPGICQKMDLRQIKQLPMSKNEENPRSTWFQLSFWLIVGYPKIQFWVPNLSIASIYNISKSQNYSDPSSPEISSLVTLWEMTVVIISRTWLFIAIIHSLTEEKLCMHDWTGLVWLSNLLYIKISL